MKGFDRSFLREHNVEMFERLFYRNSYTWFDNNKPFNVNLIGFRSSNREAGVFDDYLFMIFRDNNLNWVIKQYPITTDPGLYYLHNPMRVQGTAILYPKQHLASFKLGKHKGRYEALIQAKPLTVYRDNNKDDVLDYVAPEEGWQYINFHKKSRGWDSLIIGKSSAGCQVFQFDKDFYEFMKIVKLSMSLYGSLISYTLFEDKA
jgi:hypothetical protein